MTTIAFLGDLGSGKTTMCTRMTILTKLLHPEKKIYCNYLLKNYPYEDLDLMKLYLDENPDNKNIIVVADEVYTMMDSRVSTSYRNRIESYFITMTRKAKADFYLTMQYEKFTDCRLAPFVHVKYIMENIPIRKTIMIGDTKYTYIKPHPYMFKVTVFDDRNSYMPMSKEFYFNGSRWFSEFDTNQYIKPPRDIIQQIEINQMKKEVQYHNLKEKLNDIKNKEIGKNKTEIANKRK